MKKILFLLPLFITIAGYSQELTVFYKEQRKADYYKLRSYVFEKGMDKQDLDLIKDKAKDHSEELEKYGYASVLRIDDKKSIYYPLKKQFNDTINSTVSYGKDGKQTFISRETSEKEYKIVYIDQNKKQKTSVEYAYGKEYLIDEELDILGWEITKQTKTMFGYLCKKALVFKKEKEQFISYGYGNYRRKGMRPVEVWYTEEINSSFGPLGYWGLPGLVVKVVEEDATVVLDRILYTLDGFEVKPPTQGEKITREGLEEMPALLFNKF
ncbi:GLPGLI family protein [Aquimarina litoralis]|uniref:GLPGLI family protein n=1 Tax=Aquimarina litoralis TaxID=584605 RepID=UPI001C59DB6A|nr:GLPGLI family protein [Aquimarina litoralis]MBW1295933.1 GLPGLI family protein [Aquimarina litoralis]